MQAKKTLVFANWILASLITAVVCVIHYYYWFHVGGHWRDEVEQLENQLSGLLIQIHP